MGHFPSFLPFPLLINMYDEYSYCDKVHLLDIRKV